MWKSDSNAAAEPADVLFSRLAVFPGGLQLQLLLQPLLLLQTGPCPNLIVPSRRRELNQRSPESQPPGSRQMFTLLQKYSSHIACILLPYSGMWLLSRNYEEQKSFSICGANCCCDYADMLTCSNKSNRKQLKMLARRF